ncbi:ATP-dependent RNA helicase-like protein chl1 [Lophiostoma macrostomum CBS 122681]|uniref:ATP-dependent DNA helicase CHL1 n=1 Tax=Lophiostoma macrostomum CBS 122681 TaxID=1314788 RepID=A0A6A6T4K7_9PLEO|nr:ATP-dependent RNA helicase-like protein chl1 [Lophiostoma macrostomum CBS 122681]
MSDYNAREFHHPFEPYDIQKEFMNAVYDCLEDGRVGIFESPTGTGKSLSLICGSLTWLRDFKKRAFEQGFAIDAVNTNEPDWVLEQAQKQRKEAALARRRGLEDRISKIRAKERRIKQRYEIGDSESKRRKVAGTVRDDEADEARFVLDDYDSDEEVVGTHKSNTFDDSGLSAETQVLMEQFGYSTKPQEREDEALDEIKIFFCSRTHSQLSQFSSELNRIKLPPAIEAETPAVDGSDAMPIEEVKHLTLGSRKNLCINPKVHKLGNATAINERCLELQQPGTSFDHKCQFMPVKDTEALVNDFRDHALAKIRDIEDLALLGKRLSICPYYASRPATRYCEIVTLPYPLLLQKSAREALGISLKDHVVIIDEAHNLMDAITGIYSISVTLAQFQQGRGQLTVYLQKFRNRLKGKNRVYVAQIVRVLDSIIAYLQSTALFRSSDGLADVGALMSGKGVDQINLFKLNRYLQDSRLARKVDGYTAHAEDADASAELGARKGTDHRPKQAVPVLTHVQGFLTSLMNPSAEGRFFFNQEEGGEIVLRYMLLDPTFHFKDIVENARAVVLAGGTMSPMSDYEQHLLSYLDPSRITTLSCGHVIPSSNLLAVPVVRTVDGTEFDFTFEKRNSDKTMIDLANAIMSTVQKIPDGVVVFFPSYSYLDKCSAAWKRMRLEAPVNSPSYWDALLKIKPIFLETRSQRQTSDAPTTSKEIAVNSVLDSYGAAIATGKGRGALLFAVIGGSLSEGINFNDALGRGVIVVGLPFPNPHSAEWKAKTQYISMKASAQGQDGKAAARDFYENTCMRAVNQCIGRAIRHRNDYAAILMLDRRYSAPRIQAKLPRWIRSSLANGAGVREVEKSLDEFFAGKHD